MSFKLKQKMFQKKKKISYRRKNLHLNRKFIYNSRPRRLTDKEKKTIHIRGFKPSGTTKRNLAESILKDYF